MKTERYAVDPNTGCWNWLLYKNARGYGRVGGEQVYAHRAMYELLVGPIPAGFQNV